MVDITNTLPEHFIEHEFFNKMFLHFKKDVFRDKKVIVTDSKKKLPFYGDNVIVILTAADETVIPPIYKNRVGIIFKHHFNEKSIDNIYHIPLPYPSGFSGNSDIPINSRKFDIFFSGNENGKRIDFFKMVRRTLKKPKYKHLKAMIQQTDGWMKGMSLRQYSKIMSNSKIIFSPMGQKRIECIRLTEAHKCGCVILTEKHPNIDCFTDSPMIETRKWADLEIILDKLVNNKELLNKKHIESINCYKKYYSPKAVGEYINRVVENHIN